jgi:hypothetical protein
MTGEPDAQTRGAGPGRCSLFGAGRVWHWNSRVARSVSRYTDGRSFRDAGTDGKPGYGDTHRVSELEQRAADYADGHEILPVLEVIATIVQGSPGRDGRYRIRITVMYE